MSHVCLFFFAPENDLNVPSGDSRNQLTEFDRATVSGTC